MKKHIPIIAAIRIGFGVLELLLAFFLFAILFSVGIIANERTAFEVLTLVASLSAVFLLVFGIPNIIGGIGLLKFKGWARYLVLVLSVISLFNIPLGTAVGIYGIWVLIQDETVELFSSPAKTSDLNNP